MKEFYEYELNGKKIIFYKDNVIKIQTGKGKSKYKNRYSFEAKDFGQAVMYYNMLNIHSGYKKRLICEDLNKPLLARLITYK